MYLWILLAALVCPGALADEWQAITPAIPFEMFSPKNGLPQATAKSFAQDTAGHLWIASQQGVSRFDGRAFRNFTIEDGLPRNFISHVTHMQDEIWVGDFFGNVSVYRGAGFQQVILSGEDGIVAVKGIEHYDDSILVWRSTNQVLRYNLEAPTDAEVIFDVGAEIRNVWVHNSQLWVVAGLTLYQVALDQGLAPRKVRQGVRYATVDSRNRQWLLDDQNQVLRQNGERFDLVSSLDSEIDVVEILPDDGRNFWARSSHTLIGVRFPAQSGSQATAELTTYEHFSLIEGMLITRDGSLWVGGNGLGRHLGHRFDYFSLKELGFNSQVWRLAESPSGDLFFGTEGDLLQMQGNRIRSLTRAAGLPANARFLGIASVSDTVLYAAAQEHGLYRVDLDAMSAELIDGSGELTLLDTDVDQVGQIWVLAMTGLYRLAVDGSHLQPIYTIEDESYFAMDIADDGSVWFTWDNKGLLKLAAGDSGKIDFFGEGAGFATESFNHVEWISDQEIWVAGEEGVLYRFDGKRAVNLGPSTELGAGSAYTVNKALDDSVLVGTSDGLYQIDFDRGIAHRFGRELGFLSEEVNAAASLLDSKQHAWFGTYDGLVRMDLRQQAPSVKTLVSEITSINGAENPQTDGNGLVVPWADRRIVTEFAAVSLQFPGDVEFSYKLNGRDDRWSPATRNSLLEISSLAPGRYQLLVRARLPGQPWGRPVASAPITVLSPFWRKPWFLALTVLLTLASILAFTRYRERQIKRTNQMLRQQVRERTRKISESKSRLENANRLLSEKEAMLERINTSLETKVAERTHALALAKEQAEAANDAKDRFLANMTHELRTPLNGIIGMGQLMQEMKLGERERNMLGVMMESGNTLLSIINDVLDISKINVGKLQIRPEPFWLKQLLEKTVEGFQGMAKKAGLSLELAYNPSHDHHVVSDAQRIRQVLVNLVGNAIKFTESGTVRVVADYSVDDGILMLDVIDTGVGIPATELDAIFSAFAQVDDGADRRYQGTGLGLAISRDIAGLLGGNLSVSSEPGKGSTFSLIIPLQPSGLPGSTILIEDELVSQRLAALMLRKLGFTVEVATDAASAIEAMTHSAVGVLIVSAALPVSDFEQLDKWLMNQTRAASAPALIVMTSGDSDSGFRCLADRKPTIVAKPLKLEELQLALGTAVQTTASGTAAEVDSVVSL